MKYILLIFVLVALTGCVIILPDGVAPINNLSHINSLSHTETSLVKSAAENGYNHISNDTNIRLISELPGKLGNWPEKLGRYVINYELSQHGLGYSKRYNEGSIWADVYFFHARQTGMTDGIESEQFIDLWEQSISADSFVRKCDIKDKTDTVETFNGMKLRKCQLAIIVGGKELESLMFMTVFRETFLKVRISYRPDYKNAEIEINRFMNDLIDSLNKRKI
ncbi:MAG: hypothetical protein LBH05_03150 [Deferribacteraceae bacterium]|jgi:hypothetical protein|nr:hypothetical protein [Deferribacteraceae bacterium]